MKGKRKSGDTTGNILATSAAALLLQFLFQVAAGWYLNRAYIPSPKFAHGTLEAIMGAQPHATIAGFHYWGSTFFILHSFFHLSFMMFTGWYRPPHQWRWFGALAIFGCAMLFQLTGNLLPFDQHGVQTAAIESGITAAMPGGQEIAKVLFGGEPTVNANTLPTWYFAHKLLIPIALLLGIVGAVITHLRRGDVRTFWIPSILMALIPLLIAILVTRPLGTGATADDYNRYSAMVSWYTWPLHGSLQAFNQLSPSLGWIGTAVIPALFVGFLVAAPFLSNRIANAGIQFIFVAFLSYFFGTAVAFGGKFAPLTGTRDPMTASPEPKAHNEVPLVDKALAEKGRLAFNSEGCSNCHGTDGLKATGGPKLDQVHKQHSDAEWYIAFIKDPKSKNPGSTMPGFPDLSEETLKAMAEFLRMPR